MSSSARSEVTRRNSASRVSLHSLGAVWSIQFPFKWKRTLLLGFGQGALPSGLACFVLSPTDCARLDSAMASLGRIAMM
eukprot:6826570-Pyramimonas_sp.AAC.1